MQPEIDPVPTPEEAAAIVAALESLGGGRAEQSAPDISGRGRWEVAGRLGRPLPAEMSLEGALWPLFDAANRGRSL